MNINVKESANPIASKVAVFLITEGIKRSHPMIKKANEATGNRALKALNSGELTGKKGELISMYSAKGSTDRIILTGLGSEEALSYDAIRDAAATAARAVIEAKKTECSIAISQNIIEHSQKCGQAIVEGVIMGSYSFQKYKANAESTELKSVTIVTETEAEQLKKGARIGKITADAVNAARDLMNTPANELTPFEFTQRIKALANRYKSLDLEIIDKKRAEKLGMGAFLGVAQGSENAPYMAVIRYKGAGKDAATTAIVGKGVTFDTGGISIKPSRGMRAMKGDMGGAAAVFGAVQAIAGLRPQKNIMAIIPMVENMPSGNAQRPGDVVYAMNGKSIEITNTDAEGRLILADALCYAVKEKVSKIIDLATLTGAVSVALGDLASGLLGNNQDLMDQLKEAAEYTGERLWQLPLYDEYFDYIKSDIADMINASENRLAGTASAAKFLEQFVDKTPWAHIDIASTMDYSSTKGYKVKGMSGSNVRNLVEYVLNS